LDKVYEGSRGKFGSRGGRGRRRKVIVEREIGSRGKPWKIQERRGAKLSIPRRGGAASGKNHRKKRGFLKNREKSLI